MEMIIAEGITESDVEHRVSHDWVEVKKKRGWWDFWPKPQLSDKCWWRTNYRTV